MDENKKEMLEFVSTFEESICLDWSLQLVKLLGFQEDEHDYYYVVRKTNGKISWLSGVGWLIGLKGKVEDKEYEYFENRYSMLVEQYLPLNNNE